MKSHRCHFYKHRTRIPGKQKQFKLQYCSTTSAKHSLLVMSTLVKTNADYVSIVPSRLLGDQCYHADILNMIYKPMCETTATVLSPVGSLSDILHFLQLVILETQFIVYNATSHNMQV